MTYKCSTKNFWHTDRMESYALYFHKESLIKHSFASNHFYCLFVFMALWGKFNLRVVSEWFFKMIIMFDYKKVVE